MFIPGIVASTNWPKGDFESIATAVIGSGGGTVSFTSIPATYQHLQIRIFCQTNRAATADDIYMKFNNSSADYYGYHIVYGDGASAASTANNLSSAIDLTRFSSTNAGADVFSVGIVDILDYTSVNKNKTVRSLCGTDQNGSGVISFNSGLWKPSTPVAINRIDLAPSIGTLFNQDSHFALYGIKG